MSAPVHARNVNIIHGGSTTASSGAGASDPYTLRVIIATDSPSGSGGLTDAELRATPVPVSLTSTTVTGSVAVTGPLTDAELRATPVPVSLTSTTITGSVAVTGALTDAELRATAVPVSHTFNTVTSAQPTFETAAAVVAQRPLEIWACSFADVGAGLLAMDFTQRRLGTGITVSQSAGNLVVATGTTANSEFLARSTSVFLGSWIMRQQTTLSARVVNTNFMILMADSVGEGLTCTVNSAVSITVALPGHTFTSANVGQTMFVGAINGVNGVPGRFAIASVVASTSINFTVAGWPASGSCTVDLFGWNFVKTHYTGTTATNALVDAGRRGWTSGDTTATVLTTATGHIAQTAADGRNVYWSDSLVASTATPLYTSRASRYSNIPMQSDNLYVYIWSFNGTVAPVTCTWTLGFVSVEEVDNVPVYIAGNRHQSAPMPVSFNSAQSVTLTANTPVLAAGTSLAADVGLQYRTSATGGASVLSVLSLGTTAATSIKASAGRLIGWQLVNTAATLRSVKIFAVNAPTLGVTAASFEIDLIPNAMSFMNLSGGIGYGTAHSYAVTSAKGLTDNTAGTIAANDVSGSFFFA